ncbi:hypothetical protein L210DRAFT_3533827 [Boletus edulis BED1]|uniref:Uncharacterized protein n=1 Tax=Boletus edulis BED1 TaxID=1328754 RepID=A0AAD4GHI3_BOLED|nr:hypothetical protein L210DRAFT_3533827 [Boletus edulis BED1]
MYTGGSCHNYAWPIVPEVLFRQEPTSERIVGRLSPPLSGFFLFPAHPSSWLTLVPVTYKRASPEMSTNDIPLDQAELLAMVLEAFLYGFSLFMFGGTIWTLWHRQTTLRVKCNMLIAACSLLLFSTVHLVIDIIRVMEGFIWLSKTYEGGRIMYFSDVSHWTFVSKNYVYAAQTLIGDGVVLYRCYAVWKSKRIMILPVLLWCTVGVTGFTCPYIESQLTRGSVFEKTLSRWITSFWASTLTTNTVTTLMLAYRLWNADRATTRLSDHRKSELRPILHIIVDAGGIYSLTLLTALVCYLNKSNGQYVILDMIMPIISITFYMVIIRVGIAFRVNQLTQPHSFGPIISGHGLGAERRSRVQIDISASRRSKVENGERLSMSPVSPDSDVRRSEVKMDVIEEKV